jgi:hypothetical protein
MFDVCVGTERNGTERNETERNETKRDYCDGIVDIGYSIV